MAGFRGNVAWLMAAKQSVKGTPATVATATTYKLPFSGGSIGPVRELDNLAETDASRDQGISYVVNSGVEGSPEFYVRDSSVTAWLYWALGAIASTPGTAAVTTIALTGVPTGGSISYTATVGGNTYTTAPLAFNANAAAVAAAFNALPGFPTVVGAGGPLPTAVTLTSSGSGPLPTITIATNALTGGTAPTSTIVVTTPGVAASHIVTPSNSLPYITAWRNIANTLFEQYSDCKVGSLSISAEAGQPLTATAGVQGLRTTRLPTTPDPSNLAPIQAEQVYNFNDATVTLGGTVSALVRSFELTIENNLQRQQTDDVVPYDVYEGQREVTLGFDLIFETLDEYNKFHYGGAAGTAVSKDIYTTSAVFQFDKSNGNQLLFTLPSIAYQEFPVEPSASGDPVTVSVRAVGQRTSSSIVTATVKNQVNAY